MLLVETLRSEKRSRLRLAVHSFITASRTASRVPSSST